MIHLTPDHLALVQKILRVYVPDRRIVVFGSRATGVRLKPHSDLDLCIMGETPLDSTTVFDLRDAFSASRLPMRVDVVDWAATSENFRTIIAAHTEEIQTPEIAGTTP